MNTWIWVSSALALGYPLLLSWALDRQRIALRATSVAIQEGGEARLALDLATHENITERDRLHAELKLVISDFHSERDKVSRYFAKISDFERERDGWQKLYHEQSIGHGNAQALMMGTIENLARQLHAKGVRAQIPKVLHEIREEFIGKHEMPARAGADALMSQAAAEPPPT
jgi:hypothetical protein